MIFTEYTKLVDINARLITFLIFEYDNLNAYILIRNQSTMKFFDLRQMLFEIIKDSLLNYQKVF